jgi:hypothetical protein
VAVAAVIAIVLTQAASPQACAAAVPVLAAGTQVTGTATHYVLPAAGGNCSYLAPPADGLFVALSPAEARAAGRWTDLRHLPGHRRSGPARPGIAAGEGGLIGVLAGAAAHQYRQSGRVGRGA